MKGITKMKKLSAICAALMLAAGAVFGQGTVSFANNGNTQILLPLPDGGTVPATSAASIWIGLFYSTITTHTAAPLEQAADQFAWNSSAGISVALGNGVFSGGTKTLGGDSAPCLIQVRVWDKAFGTGASGYWNAVTAYNADKMTGWRFFGFSPVLSGNLGNPSAGPTPLVGATGSFGFLGLTLQAPIIPEPSILALGLLGGLGTLVLIRRRQ